MQPREPDPIADDEILYRRISASADPPWLDPVTKEVNANAFAPHKKNDTTGLSVWRAKYKSKEQAAQGPAKRYYLAELRAGDLRANGIAVVPQPHIQDGYDIAHAELPDLNASNRKDSRTIERQRILAKNVLEVVGPFEATSQHDG